LAELRDEAKPSAPADRVRRVGGGRKSLAATDGTLLRDLQALVEPVTRGDPMARCYGPPKVFAIWLRTCGRRIGHIVVANLLRKRGYGLQANRKTRLRVGQ
jgi:hypothetical protein